MSKKRKAKFQQKESTSAIHSVALAEQQRHRQRSKPVTWTNKISTLRASAIITLIGFVVYFRGLSNPFQGDDLTQIVQNVPVHSIANFFLFFRGGTFYVGNGLAPLFGSYFRPLMSVMYSLVYTIFGANPIPYHVLQLAFFIGGAILVYRFFSYSLNPLVSLFFALIILVHPLNSQIVYSIACLQDAMFLFFGMLALNILVSAESSRGIYLACASLLLCLLSKESGVLFIAISLCYLYWFNRDRLRRFVYFLAPSLLIYGVIRISAVGLFHNPMSGPVDSLTLISRLLMAPALPLFYLGKLLFPVRLATGYYWTYQGLSLQHFVLPLVVVSALVALAIYFGKQIHRTSSEAKYLTFLFFGVWTAIGLILISQVAPLDMTACETWFIFSMIGLLGLLGMAWSTLGPKLNAKWLLLLAVLTILVLGGRTLVRGFDWSNPQVLADKDIATDPDNILAYGYLAQQYTAQGQYDLAFDNANHAIETYPLANNGFNNLGLIQVHRHRYAQAMDAFEEGIVNPGNNPQQAYEHIAELLLIYNDPTQSGAKVLQEGLQKYPRDTTLWSYMAILDYKNGDQTDAQRALAQLSALGQPNEQLNSIVATQAPFSIQMHDFPDFGNVKIR